MKNSKQNQNRSIAYFEGAKVKLVFQFLLKKKLTHMA
jgi:hypothetical protein